MARNYAPQTLAYAELDELAEIVDRSPLTTDDLRSVCLNLINAVERMRKQIERLTVRVTDLEPEQK